MHRSGRTSFSSVAIAIVVLASTLLGVGALRIVDAATGGSASSFVPIAPCRLADTRTSSRVGPRATPIGQGESVTFTVRGSNGDCSIPSDATGITANVTSVNPSAASYLTVWPADVTRPNASSLNYVAGQPPTPNAVTVTLSADGRIKAYNNAGTVDLIIDISGYYLGLPTPEPTSRNRISDDQIAMLR